MRVWPADTRKRMHYRIIAGAGNRIHGVRLPYIHTYIHTHLRCSLNMRRYAAKESDPACFNGAVRSHTHTSGIHIHTKIHKYECLLIPHTMIDM